MIQISNLKSKLLKTTLLLFLLALTGCRFTYSLPDSETTIGDPIDDTEVSVSQPKITRKKNTTVLRNPSSNWSSNVNRSPDIPTDINNITQLNKYFTIMFYGNIPSFSNISLLNDQDIINLVVHYRHTDPASLALFKPVDANVISLSKEQVERDAFEFFGVSGLKHDGTGAYNFENNGYLINVGDGPPVHISKVSDVKQITDSIVEISGINYTMPHEFTGNVDDSAEEWAKLDGDWPEQISSFTAKMTKEPVAGTYILTEYNLKDKVDSPPIPLQWNYVTSSSQLVDKTGPYPATNATDNNKDTAWAEGATGNGEGEWIYFENPSGSTIRQIDIINGYAKSQDLYYKNSRVKKLRLDFDSYSTIFSFEDNNLLPQTLKLPDGIFSTNLQATILEVYPGNKYEDTCMSEIKIYR